jgi:hypothetical protein
MKKIVCLFALISMAMVPSFSVNAEGSGINANNFYLGGGLGFNSGATGFQFFGGYDFDFIINEDISTAVELGYMDSGDFDNDQDFKGLWVAAVESVPLSSKVDMLVRLGVDFGDDDGILFGAGLQYKFNTKAAFRVEHVVRDHIDSLQANVLFKF